jgi:hypothetical protein
MSKIGVSLSIDVTAIIKEHMLKHQNGKTYLDMTVFIDPGTEDNYGNHGMIVQNWKDAPKKGTPILGNAKIFWREPNDQQPQSKPANNTPASFDPDSFDDDCPF